MVVDELTAVVAMKATDDRWNLMQHRLQDRQHVPLANRLYASHHLPLRHRVHGVDVIRAGGLAWLAVPERLVRRADAQEPRPAKWLRLAALADIHRGMVRVLHASPHLAVRFRVSEVLEV